jgi:hypothetical protein
VLSVQFDDGNDRFEITPVGKGGNYYQAGMSQLGYRLVLRPTGGQAVSYVLDTRSDTWTSVAPERIAQLFCGETRALCEAMARCGAPFAVSDRLYLSAECAALNGRMVWSRTTHSMLTGVDAAAIHPVYLDAEIAVLMFHQTDRSGFIVCSLSGGILKAESCSRHRFETPGEFSYAVFRKDNQILLTTNLGGAHLISAPGMVWRMRPTDKLSQAYAALSFGKHTVFGMYPYGELFDWSDEFSLLSAPTEHRAGRDQWEVQSLATYKGRLFAGMWPWGTVYMLDRDLAWIALGRLFNHPRNTASAIGPYFLKAPVVNRLNQRITDLIPLGDALYALTGSKDWSDTDWMDVLPEEEIPLTADQISEYGTLYRIHSTGSLAIPLPEALRKDDRITVEVTLETLTVRLNGQRIGNTRVALKDEFCLASFRKGMGLMGPAHGFEAGRVRLDGSLPCSVKP